MDINSVQQSTISSQMVSHLTQQNKTVENKAIDNKEQSNNTTANDALSSINKDLDNIKKLSVQASNGLYGTGEKQLIQKDIEQLKNSIEETAKTMTDEEKNSLNIAIQENNKELETEETSQTDGTSTLSALGLKDFDVTKEFDISNIDTAIQAVSSAEIGNKKEMSVSDHIITANAAVSKSLQAPQTNAPITDSAKEDAVRSYEYYMDRQEKEATQSTENVSQVMSSLIN